MALRIRRGTENQRQVTALDQGEIAWTTDTRKLYIGLGTGQVGNAGMVNVVASAAGTGLVYNAATQTLDVDSNTISLTTTEVPEGINQYFTTERAQDAASAAFQNGIHSGISFTYGTTQDNANRIDATVALSLNSLTNVTVTGTPSAGQALVWDTGSSKWVNGTAGGLSSDTNPTLISNLNLNGYNIEGDGGININGLLQTTLTTGSRLATFTGVTTGSVSPDVTIQVSRFSGGQTTVENGDILHSYSVEAYNGSVYKKASFLQTTVASPLAGGNFKSRTDLYVSNGLGDVSVFGFDGLGVFSSAAVRFVPLPQATINAVTPETGGVVYNSTTNSLQIYNGTNYANALNLITAVPSTATSSGNPGQVAYDSSYIYLCVATDSWIRADRVSF